MATSGEIQFFVGEKSTPAVPITLDEIKQFIKGEVPPATADRFLPAGMPKRGLVRYVIRTQSGAKTITIGPAMARRAGTMSSAL